MPLAPARRRTLPKPAPQADPRFRKVLENVKQGAAKVKAHPPARKKAAEASAAAKGPPNEKLAAGKAKQVDKIQEAPAKKPETNSFLALLRAEIQNAMPKTLGDTEQFMKGGSSGQLKGSLKGNVNQKKEEAAGGVKSASKEAPQEAGAAKDAKPLPVEPAPGAPAVNGAEGMPAPKSEAEVSLQDSKPDAEAQLKDAQVTPEQLQKANDPRFSAVLSAKDAVGRQADAAPGKYRAGEKGALSVGAAQAQAEGRRGAAAAAGVRGGSNSAVLSKQQLAKQKEELERKQVSDRIEGIYAATKASVEAKLAGLETEVGGLFDAGVDAALKAMTDYVDDRIFKFKLERYLGSPIGLALYAKDKLLGPAPEVNAILETGRTLFTGLMDRLVERVAALVERRLKEAKDAVAKGQAEIKAYVAGLDPKLRAFGEGAAKEVGGRFEELERGIEEKKNQLAQQLAEKYKEAFDKANEALKKVQDENRGLVDVLAEKLGEVIKILTEFKAKLMAILKKGEDTIKLILADPIGFLGNLIAALKLGFNQFKAKIKEHLIKGFFAWLFGALAEAGIEIPDGLPSLPSILKLVLAVLGITYERMRAKAVKLLGERAVKVIETLVKYVKALIEGGPAKLWEQIKSDLSDLKDMVIGAIQDYIITTVVQRAIAKLVTLFNPVGAIVQAVLAIYDTVTFLIEKASQIMALVEAVVNSVNAIATGAIGGAANWIEQALARTIPVVIGFLAQFVGLGKVSKKIKEFILKVQARVDKAIDKAIAKVVAMVKKLIGKLTGKDKKDERTDDEKKADLNKAVGEAKALDAKERPPKKLAKALAKIKSKYRLTDLTATPKENVASIHAAINPDVVFELESEEVSGLGKKLFALAQPGIAALASSARGPEAEAELRKAFVALKVKKGSLQFVAQDVATTGTYAQVYLLIPSADEPRELIGAIWNASKLFVPRGGDGPATKFTNKKTNAPVVQDAGGQFVQRYVVRDINAEDRKAFNEDRPISARKPEASRFPHQLHSMGQVERSPYISTSTVPENEKIYSLNRQTGERKPFYDPKHGRVRIDLDFIKKDQIFNVATTVGQNLWNFDEKSSEKAKIAVQDAIRTKEVLVKGKIPRAALTLIREGPWP